MSDLVQISNPQRVKEPLFMHQIIDTLSNTLMHTDSFKRIILKTVQVLQM